MDREMLGSLLDFKANNGGRFSEDEAATDMAINSERLSKYKQRDLAKRWKWSQSMVSRLWKLLGLAKEGVESSMNQIESNHWEIEPESHTLNQIESKHPISTPSEVEAKERVSPHTPLPKENPLQKKENPPKGGEKKENFPPANAQKQPEKPIGGDTGEKSLVEGRAAPPCSEAEAEGYFRIRLEKDPAAVAKGFQSALLAQSFWWHWDAKHWVDKEGKVITANTWKLRAATWYRLKEKYNHGIANPHSPKGKSGEGKLPAFTSRKTGVMV